MDETLRPRDRRQSGTTWTTWKNHRVYGAALGDLVVARIILQVAAVVQPGFGAPESW